MKKLFVFFLIISLVPVAGLQSQVRDKAGLEKGMNFIETRTFTAEEDAKILEL